MLSINSLRQKFSYYQEKYNLKGYTLKGLAGLAESCPLSGKSVLELGGWNIPPEITLGDLGAKKWICVDMIGSVSGSYQQKTFPHLANTQIYNYSTIIKNNTINSNFAVIDGDATNLPEIFYNEFDVVVSFAALEHVLDVPTFLLNCYRALKKDGHAYLLFGPIWSSHAGHHVFVNSKINFLSNSHIEEWEHLLCTPAEMLKNLTQKGVVYADACKAVYQIYTSSRINRYFAEDYIEFIKMSNFSSYSLEPQFIKIPQDKVLNKLTAYYPRYKDFSTYSLLIKAFK